MADELLDLVNEKDEVIGTVWKSEAHRDLSKIHCEVAVIVFTKQGETLLQRRSSKKKHDPGVWQITAAGHVSAGEDPKRCAERELFEEMGIKVRLKFVKKFKNQYKKESRIFYLYCALVDKNPRVKINKEEVEEARWIKFSDLEKFFGSDKTFAERASFKILYDTIKLLKLQ